MTRMSGAIAACALLAVSTTAAAAPLQVQERANIPSRSGEVRRVDLLKQGKHLETVTCGDFGLLDESFRPQAVVYAANYGPKGKPHPTVTVDGVENVVPIVVQQCKAQPGNHFLTAVRAAMKAARIKG
ncbi:MAG: HdeA/HdeB family chaperone [Sphingomonas sp.]